MIKFIKTILSGILKIVLFPFSIIFKILKKVFFRPITFITVNINKNLIKFSENFVKKVKRFNKNKKNTSQKKGFPV